MPTNVQADSGAQRITNQQERVSRESREGLFGSFIFTNDRVLDRLRNVGVMREVFF